MHFTIQLCSVYNVTIYSKLYGHPMGGCSVQHKQLAGECKKIALLYNLYKLDFNSGGA